MTESPVMRVRQYPPALVALGWLVESSGSTANASPFDTIDTVRDACSMVSLWWSEYEHEMARLEERADERVRRADAWLRRREDHPWQAPFTSRRQLTATRPGMPPDREAFVLTNDRPRMRLRPAQALVTVTEMESEGPRTKWIGGPLNYAEHGSQMWGLRPTADARILEVRTTTDWHELVSSYPRLVERHRFAWNNSYADVPGPFYLVAWDSVAADWDGVRFTLSGLIDNDFALVEVRDGYTMLIDEETGEQTIWLRWVFDTVEDLGDAGECFREPERIRPELPEYVLVHMAKEHERLLAGATERMRLRTAGEKPPEPFPGGASGARRIDPPAEPSDGG